MKWYLILQIRWRGGGGVLPLPVQETFERNHQLSTLFTIRDLGANISTTSALKRADAVAFGSYKLSLLVLLSNCQVGESNLAITSWINLETSTRTARLVTTKTIDKPNESYNPLKYRNVSLFLLSPLVDEIFAAKLRYVNPASTPTFASLAAEKVPPPSYSRIFLLIRYSHLCRPTRDVFRFALPKKEDQQNLR